MTQFSVPAMGAARFGAIRRNFDRALTDNQRRYAEGFASSLEHSPCAGVTTLIAEADKAGIDLSVNAHHDSITRKLGLTLSVVDKATNDVVSLDGNYGSRGSGRGNLDITDKRLQDEEYKSLAHTVFTETAVPLAIALGQRFNALKEKARI